MKRHDIIVLDFIHPMSFPIEWAALLPIYDRNAIYLNDRNGVNDFISNLD